MNTLKQFDLKPIVVHTATKKTLDELKLVSMESYDSVIVRALKTLKESEVKV
jgi:hypothetical protein